MSKTITISGEDELAQALKKYGKAAEIEIEAAVIKTALELSGDIRKRIQRGPKTGVVYHRIYDPESGNMRVYAGGFSEYGPNKLVAVFKTGGSANLSPTHQSSAPGEAPATDTGRLANSILFKQETKLSATVSSQLIYASYLEFGTRKIAPRPSWVPATEAIRPKFRKRLEDALRKVQP